MSHVDRDRFAKDLEADPVIAILRGVTPETVLPVCDALYAGGIRFIEITMNSRDPIDGIRKTTDHFEGRDAHIGAGTVLRPGDVDLVADAGGTYIISPNFNPAVVTRTRDLGLVSIPGILTPTEGFAATDTGADYLKIFPASVHGPGYLKDLQAVLPTPLIAVGGVNTDNVNEYLQVAAAAGVGSSLYTPGKLPEEIRQSTTEYMASLR